MGPPDRISVTYQADCVSLVAEHYQRCSFRPRCPVGALRDEEQIAGRDFLLNLLKCLQSRSVL